MRPSLLDAVRAARELLAVLPRRGVIATRADALVAALTLLAGEAPAVDPIRIVRLDDAGSPVAVAAAVPTVDARPVKARRPRRPRPAAVEVEVMPPPIPPPLDEQHPEDPVSPLAARFAGLGVRS